MKYLKRFTVILLISIISFNLAAQNDYSNQVKKFGRVLRLVESLYVDSVNQEKIVEEAVIAMLKELDPHSIYISKDEVKRINEPLKGAFEGIGIQFNIMEDTLMVVATIPGGPSEKLGIMAGDRIVKVDGKNIAGIGLKNSDVRDMLRGKKGTKVNVKIKRRGVDELLKFTIVRDKIPIFSVNAGYVIDNEIGYVKLNRFSRKTKGELNKVFDNFEEKEVDKVILDLSGNGGGYMNIAIWLADQFLDNDELIVYTEGKSSPKQEYNASEDGRFEDAKIVVIVDESSASASEIVSGAIQDWDRGVVVGRRTFGKGLVQRPYPLPDSSMIRLTVARYYTPSGRCIQKPYKDGKKKYSREVIERYNNGELTNEDSIHFPDSLMYKTLRNERKVYGGGGIMPDVFIPYDTSRLSDYHSKLLRKGVIFNFAIEYIDENRKSLNDKYPEFENFEDKFSVTDELMSELFDYAEQEGIDKNVEDIPDKQMLRLETHLKALIASDIWETNEFYEVNNKMNENVKTAVEILKNKKQYNSLLKK